MLSSYIVSVAQRSKVAGLLVLFFSTGGAAQTTLEEQFHGIEICNIKNIFLDPISHNPSGKYFLERKLVPCQIGEIAFYCVSDSFYRLHVSQVAIPYIGPFSVHAIYLREDVEVVESALRAIFKDIKLNRDDGTSAMLIADPKQPGSSIFYCDEHSE